MLDCVSEFIDFLRANGIGPARSSEIVADDRIRRYQVEGDRSGERNAVYRLGVFDGGYALGWVKSHKHTDRALKFRSGGGRRLTPAERAAFAKEMEARRMASAEARREDRLAGARKAVEIWMAARPAAGTHHPYIRRKRVRDSGLRLCDAGDLLVPLSDEGGRLWNLQTITAKGSKKFLYGARIKGLYCPIGKRPFFYDKPFIVCEGWATGMTLHMATGCPVVCAMNAGNLRLAGAAIRRKFVRSRILFAADFDYWTLTPEGRRQLPHDTDPHSIPGDDHRWDEWRDAGLLVNTGREKSEDAAKWCGGSVISLPEDVYGHRRDKPTDFNDMMLADGMDAVRAVFAEFLT